MWTAPCISSIRDGAQNRRRISCAANRQRNEDSGNRNIGANAVAHARADGHTLLLAGISLAANPALYRKLPFAPLSDFAPISLIANSPNILVVNPALPVNSIAELIEYLKARPGQLNYASYGAGSSAHLAAEFFQDIAGVKMVQVPYPGGNPAVVALLRGDVHVLFSSVLPVLEFIRNGDLKPLAIAADRRLAIIPDVPTFIEHGFDYRMGTWFGLLAPAKTPPAIIDRLNTEVLAMLQGGRVRARLLEQGAEVIGSTPAEFARFLKDETDRLSIVIKRANIQLD